MWGWRMTSDGRGDLTEIFTLVLWTGCLCVGAVGLLYPESDWRAARPKPVVQTNLVNVEMVQDEIPQPQAGATIRPAATAAPPPPPAPIDAPAPPPLVAVAAPMPILPVRAPPVSAPPARSAAPAPAPVSPTAARQLTLGRGEGARIVPEYPYEARIEQQQGMVTVRFTVGSDGSVADAAAVWPCPYPLLNEEALRAVRDAGPFAPGLYEVRINFALTRR